MRSAGCIVNDIADKNFDKEVERTKNRPIASGKVSIFKASIYATILCIIAFIVLINFNLLTSNEKNYLFKYHLEVYSKISKYLKPNEKKWLASFI